MSSSSAPRRSPLLAGAPLPMLLLLLCFVCSASAGSTTATASTGAGALVGPFVLWGVPRLQHIKLGALQRLDDAPLRDIYAEAETIVVFVRNATGAPLRTDAFPAFGQLLVTQSWTYLAQRDLTLDPIEYSGNAEIISLVGSASQQDVEISALFNDAVLTYGAGKVLGILANEAAPAADGQSPSHRRHRRAEPLLATTEASAVDEPTGDTPTTGGGGGDEPMVANYVYMAPGKAMLYTTAAPQLIVDGGAAQPLRYHGLVTSDERKDELVRLIVTFKLNGSGDAADEMQKVVLRFRFPIANGYWTLASVELEETMTRDGGDAAPRKTELSVVGAAPSAPIGFSYHCSAQPVVFRRNATTLRLQTVQVQPVLVAERAFSDAWDCVGFVSGGILSGFFVVTIMLTALFVALACISDIRTPNKFESARGKQLTFVVQE